MDTGTFETELRATGYTEIETKRYEPKPANGEHAHHFDVRGLVLEGAFIVIADGKPVTYRVGDTFAVANGRMHCEEIGPDGARVLIGRRF